MDRPYFKEVNCQYLQTLFKMEPARKAWTEETKRNLEKMR